MKSAVIIGAGPSGLFAAQALRAAGVKDIFLLEKELDVGGKCKTYYDQQNPQLHSEYGAMLVTHNYGVVLDTLRAHHLKLESQVSGQNSSELLDQFAAANWYQKIKLGFQFMAENAKFMYHVKQYKHAVQNKTPIPADYQLSIREFCKRYHLKSIPLFLKPFVPGFGYGSLDVCPMYSAFQYMGYTTILGVALSGGKSLLAIQQGYQSLLKAMAQSFSVKTDAIVREIQRDNQHVIVNYEHQGQTFSLQADMLVLAISPTRWKDFNMNLSSIEQKCYDSVQYYQYPVAICKVKGLPANHYFFREGLEQNGFGKLSLITTSDSRHEPSDGRLVTAYINLHPGQFFDWHANQDAAIQDMVKTIQTIPGVTDIEILDTKVWPEYLPSLPWECRLELNHAQLNENRTLYIGAYCLGGFEDVACVAEIAEKTVRENLAKYTKRKSQNCTALEIPGRWLHFIWDSLHAPSPQARLASPNLGSTDTHTSVPTLAPV